MSNYQLTTEQSRNSSNLWDVLLRWRISLIILFLVQQCELVNVPNLCKSFSRLVIKSNPTCDLFISLRKIHVCKKPLNMLEYLYKSCQA